MIKVFNRTTKEYEVEEMAGESLLMSQYNDILGKVGLELLFKRKFFSAIIGLFCDLKLSARKIEWFVKEFGIDLSTSAIALEDFKSFNHFFTRKLKNGSRVFADDPELLLSSGDGRLRAWNNIDISSLVQVKGFKYSLKELLQDNALASEYQGGTCLILRLSPLDYHRFHFMDSGICGETRKIKGYYYSVNQIALSAMPEVFCRNKREYCVFRRIILMRLFIWKLGLHRLVPSFRHIILRLELKGEKKRVISSLAAPP